MSATPATLLRHAILARHDGSERLRRVNLWNGGDGVYRITVVRDYGAGRIVADTVDRAEAYTSFHDKVAEFIRDGYGKVLEQ